ncbi:Na+/H+ antiporter [Reticulibacter mediterranei]|uniref:Na+/H+ antiporter n=1 Tax=Reticulibacter mediterranei TaxID=2778369 RepID=A0A8J3IAX2_9CHLR|nr:Na+/H+ antiporter [Reticulibacter mediterranei]GHO90243.1 Na+/H+ antiporter [Reticulibacter mediterranei]
MTATITLTLGLLVATLVLASLATRFRVPYAILLVLGGALLGLVPALPEIDLDPEVILFLFLPPLVYSSAWQTSWRTFRSNLRPILLLAVGLVLFTTACVALVAQLLLGLSWPVAFVLGAILSPTDAVAASAIAQRMHLSARVVTILEGESMVNDATGLVVYTFAVAAAVSGQFALGEALWQFVLVSAGGLAIGLLVGWPLAWLHSHIDDAPIEITMTLLTPFAAYLLAEAAHVSGVLATLSAGLYLSRHSSRFFSSTTRLQANAVWNVLVFLLNGLLFLLIGLQLRHLLATLLDGSAMSIVGQAILISLTVILVRLLWVFASAYLPRWALSAVRAHDPYPSPRGLLVVAWTGLRGGISLAAALALPLTLTGGKDFSGRELLIAITFGVILVTLVGQGLSLIPLIRWLGATADDTAEQERQRARLVAARSALARLRELSGEAWVPQDLVESMRSRYEEKAAHANEHLDGTLLPQEDTFLTYQRLQREIIAAQRSAVIRLRDQGQIDDEVLRALERELDLEEQRFAGQE